MTIDEAIEQAAKKRGWNDYAQVLKYVATVQGSEKTLELVLKDAMVIFATAAINAAVEDYRTRLQEALNEASDGNFKVTIISE